MRFILSLATFALLAGCATVVPPAPQPAAPPPPPPVPVTPPPPPTVGSDWRDWPVTPGGWSYRQEAAGSVASFGRSSTSPVFALRCDRTARQLRMERLGAAAGSMTVQTSSTARNLAAQSGAGGATASLPATDPLFDAMGFSRGRFIVETAPQAPLVLPAWAEVLRVVEDCRR